MRSLIIPSALGFLLFWGGTAEAQLSSAMQSTSRTTATGLGGGYYPYTPYGYGSSSLAEGILNGRANVIAARGDFNYKSSLASINHEVAYAQGIENDARATQVFFEMKHINREFQASQQSPRMTEEQGRQWAKALAPQRPNARQLDPFFGRILWPAAFQRPEYAGMRARLEELFAARDMTTGVGSENYRDIVAATAELKDQLKTKIEQMDTAEYIAASKFVTSLAYEARFVPGIEGVAAK